MTQYGYSYEVPSWLEVLPKGKYTIYEMCDLTGQNYNNLYKRIRHFEVSKCLVNDNGKQVTKYDWRGHKYYNNKFKGK